MGIKVHGLLVIRINHSCRTAARGRADQSGNVNWKYFGPSLCPEKNALFNGAIVHFALREMKQRRELFRPNFDRACARVKLFTRNVPLFPL